MPRAPPLAGIERTLFAISSRVVLVRLAGLVATLLASLNERRRELAILRSLGAGPRDIFLMLTAEGLCITACGAMFGIALLVAGLWAGAPQLTQLGVGMPGRPPGTGEIGLLLAILAVGLLASLAYVACRRADTPSLNCVDFIGAALGPLRKLPGHSPGAAPCGSPSRARCPISPPDRASP